MSGRYKFVYRQPVIKEDEQGKRVVWLIHTDNFPAETEADAKRWTGELVELQAVELDGVVYKPVGLRFEKVA